MLPRFAPLAVAALLAVATPASAALFPYEFQAITESPGPFPNPSGASLNEDGTVFFSATPTGGAPGYYQGRPGDLRPVEFSDFDDVRGVTRNNGNEYAVFGTRTGETAPGLYRVSPGGVVTTVADPAFFSAPLYAGPAISDSGHVAFATGDIQFQRVYVGDGAAAPSQKLFSSGNLELLKITPDGRALTRVTASVLANTLALDGQAIVTQNQGYFVKGVADAAGGNRVVFPALGPGTANELFVWQDGTITPVPDSALLGNSVVAEINDAGVVAALNTLLQGGGQQIALYKDGVRQPVISAGDELFGSTITGLGFGQLNNADQFTFSATLADGRSVTVLATPVPEPAAAGLVALGGLLALRRRRRGAAPPGRGAALSSEMTRFRVPAPGAPSRG